MGCRYPSPPDPSPSPNLSAPTLAAASLELKAEKKKAHSRSVNSVAFSPDGKTIVSGSDDKTLKVWDAVNFRPFDESEWEEVTEKDEDDDEEYSYWRNKVTGDECDEKPSSGEHHSSLEPRDDQSLGCGCVGTDTPEPLAHT